MHGREKKHSVVSPEERSIIKSKVTKASGALHDFLYRYGSHCPAEDVGVALATINRLQAFAEVPTLWAIRRRLTVLPLSCLPTQQRAPLVDQEMDFNAQILRKHPKSYSVWHHRLWLLDLLRPKPATTFRVERSDVTATYSAADMEAVRTIWLAALTAELALIRQLLEVDGRNFHCWNYYQLILRSRNAEVSVFSACRLPADREENRSLAEHLISRNFSNFSAWHLLAHENEDLDLLWRALWTDGNDQSLWTFLNWSLTKVLGPRRILRADVNDSTIEFSEPVQLLAVEVDGIPVTVADAGNRYRSTWCVALPAKVTTLTVHAPATTHYVMRPTGSLLVPIPDANVVHTVEAMLSELECFLEEEECEAARLVWLRIRAALGLLMHVDLQFLDTLADMDPLRNGFYSDLRASWSSTLDDADPC
ncbi:MAG: hypothetical protein KVP17_000575 [Porospora cf. gigantea B]|uniref:uncharacterized protein n=1 Tax=Porospora cf. gigantea B TaxID=2853592 RepID=UPI003571ED23|nr:MAG: hypothetical protein KVP17_000575 [Porospora cf. gigantea B]